MFDKIGFWITGLISAYGYGAIVIAMVIESTFIPLPSELILIPAGFLWQRGLLNPVWILVFALIGTLIGSYFTYWLGEKYGKAFVLRYGKYFFIDEKKLKKVDLLFEKYGSASVFFGRLILGVRHYISFPAGIAKMDKTKFVIYTLVGAGLWSLFLTLLGYFIGDNLGLVKEYINLFTITVLSIVAVVILYLFSNRFLSHLRRKRDKDIGVLK